MSGFDVDILLEIGTYTETIPCGQIIYLPPDLGITLTAVTSPGTYTYLWTGGSTTDSIDLTTSVNRDIYVSVFDTGTSQLNACSVSIRIIPLTATLTVEANDITRGLPCNSSIYVSPDTTVNVTANVAPSSAIIVPGILTYTWKQGDDVIGGNEPDINIIAPDVDTGYSVEIENETTGDVYTCFFTLVASELQLQLNTNFEPPTISDGQTVYIDYDPNNQITASPSGGDLPYTYAWTLPDGSTNTNPTVSATQNGTYTVTVTDERFQTITYTFELIIAQCEDRSLSVPNFTIDGQPISCGGVYIKFCDLSARICNTINCNVAISANIETNEVDSVDYVLRINGSNVRTGTVAVVNQYASTPVYIHELNSQYTTVCVEFSNGNFIRECCAAVQRLNSNIVFPGCQNY